MIARSIERIRRIIWTWRQPLTHIPAEPDSPISDLFIWRNSNDWQTFFELIDIASLFEVSCAQSKALVVFFDSQGTRILDHSMVLRPNKRQTLAISSIVGREYGEMGTFAVFHNTTPQSIKKLNSFLTERGYVSYRYRNAPLRAFVHGNFDAIAYDNTANLRLLGGISYLSREYHLQHKLESEIDYEFGLVNPTKKTQCLTLKFFLVDSDKEVSSCKVKIHPGGLILRKIKAGHYGAMKCIIRSNLVMARPLVFCINNHKLDIFHG